MIGDIIGSPYEGHAIKTTQFPLFSQRSRFPDDTVLTVATAVALAILISREGKSKADIKTEIAGRFGYDLDRSLDEIRPAYRFDVTCQGSVPEAIIAFLESNDYEIPENIISQAAQLLPEQFRNIIAEFKNRYNTGGVQI